MEKQLHVGDVVRLDQRLWKRPGEVGRIVAFDGSAERGANKWLIQFPDPYPGGGIEGCQIYLNDRQFVVEQKGKH